MSVVSPARQNWCYRLRAIVLCGYAVPLWAIENYYTKGDVIMLINCQPLGPLSPLPLALQHATLAPPACLPSLRSPRPATTALRPSRIAPVLTSRMQRTGSVAGTATATRSTQP
eukprot:586031-Rhodomonas_salina.4